MAKKKKGKKIGLKDPFRLGRKGEADVFRAAADQVQVDFEMDRLAKRQSAGKISDREYIRGLERVRDNIRKGVYLKTIVRKEQIAGAQTIADRMIGDIETEQTDFISKAQRRWTKAQNDYSSGQISLGEYDAERDLWESANEQLQKVPGEKKVTRQVLSGKAFEKYKSGRIRNVMRNKKIRAEYEEQTGELDKKEIRKLRKTPAKFPYLKQAISLTQKARAKSGRLYAYGETRDLSKEQQAVGILREALGRLPTAEEIKAYVYGGYPIEYITAEQYSPVRKFIE